jgi:DNA helicase-2/ATP-dependent DNA helicase PcrA
MNAAQQKAVMHATGPAMVLAGPGSGKTFVIAQRLKQLIEAVGAEPSQILVITFTKASAVEMQIRFLKLTDSAYPEVSFGTFHSIFYQIIRHSLSDSHSGPEIADIRFQTETVRDILSELKNRKLIGREEFENSCGQIPEILSEISRIKNLDRNPEDCSEGLPIRHVFKEIFELYGKRLAEFGKIDFDDMMVRCYKLLSENRSILENWQKRFKFILIDEYQDINPIQSKIIDLLLGRDKNLFAVGDDDQSIYGFRGSDPGIMLAFKEKYEDACPNIINLNINYRSGSEILKNAGLVIRENKKRLSKELMAFEGNGKGAVIARCYNSANDQRQAIALFLSKHRQELSDIAILFRTNSEARSLVPALKEMDIPSNLDSYEKNIYRDRAVDTVISYLKFGCRGQKRSDFLKIINVPQRYVSREAAEKEIIKESDILLFYRENIRRQKEIKSFFKAVSFVSHLRPALAVRYLIRSVGIGQVFKDSQDALDELEKDAAKFQDMRKFIDMADELKEKKDAALKDDQTDPENRVNLLTMHSSKGLEFGLVWIPNLNEGIIPTRSAVGEDATEEERRMLYVAMTRAKRALIMSYVRGSKENPMLPSRFLRPIRQLWDENYGSIGQTSSDPSSGRSMSSSNSASSR